MPHQRETTPHRPLPHARQRRHVVRPRHSVGEWAPLGAFILLVVALAGTYRASAVTVSLSVDGHRRQLTTHTGTVADLLLEHQIDVQPGDLVQPGPQTRLVDGLSILIQRARPARVRVDGRVVRLRTHGQSALAVLQEAGITLGPRDRVHINGRPWPVDQPAVAGRPTDVPLASRPVVGGSRLLASAGRLAVRWPEGKSTAANPDGPSAVVTPVAADPPPADSTTSIAANAASTAASAPPVGPDAEWVIDVLRAVPVTLVEDGIRFELELAGATVGEALRAAGIPLYPEDLVKPAADAPLYGGIRIDILRATPFVVQVDGATRSVRAWADTVGEGLARAGIQLVGRDYAIPAIDTPLTAGLEVQVVRVVEDILVREVSIPYSTITQPDPEMALDETKVLRPGEPGLKTQRLRITYEDGVEVQRQIEEETVQREPVPEILAYGTKIVWRTVETPEGPRRYWRRMRVYATSYSASRAGTPRSAPWYGRTWLGLQMRHGIVAVDPRYIPLGTNLYVPGYGIGLAGDTGGGIKRYHIDLGFDDDNYESWHQYVDVYLLEPLPPEDQIPWYLP